MHFHFIVILLILVTCFRVERTYTNPSWPIFISATFPKPFAKANMSLPINTTNSTQMNETSGLSNFTDLTDTSATGNVSENLRSIYNTTQANNAMMSNDWQLVPFVKKYLMVKTILFHYPHFSHIRTGQQRFNDNCDGC